MSFALFVPVAVVLVVVGMAEGLSSLGAGSLRRESFIQKQKELSTLVSLICFNHFHFLNLGSFD